MKQMKERDRKAAAKVLEDQARRERLLAGELERGDGEEVEEGERKGKGKM